MQAISIASDDLAAQIIPFGASLTDLRLKHLDRPLVLGFRDLDDYARDKQYMGAVIGRYANRIARGHVALNGKTLNLECNENGTAHLHGGTMGFGRQTWTVEESNDSTVTLAHESPDGEGGYPGNFRATAEYKVTDATLRLTLSAVSDRDTIVNLCHHPYFNLDGHQDISRHQVWIAANTYLPTDDALMPLGHQADVTGSPYDFLSETTLPDCQFNNTYCLHQHQSGPLREVARLIAGGVCMHLATTQPGLHLYNGYKIKPSFLGLHGATYAARAGICLEAQAWPDSPHVYGAPEVDLKAGQLYRQVTEYRFA